MRAALKNFFYSYFDVDFYENIKMILLALSFFFVIGGYTIAKELKDSVFINTVGKYNLPMAKLWSTFVFIAPLFLYSKLVDWFRRSQLIYIYFLFYGIAGIACAYYIGHPTIGIPNTNVGAHRYFGWFFYFFMEGYAPFIVSLMWAFTNSISKPSSVKTNYVIMTLSSKLGGLTTAGFAWWFLHTYDVGLDVFSEVQSYQVLQVVASLFLLCVPIVILLLMRYIPGRYLHGYEVVYKAEKQKKKERQSESWWESIKHMFNGVGLLVRYPYMLGIFGMIFCWEALNVWINYMRLSLGHQEAESVSAFGSYLFQQAFYTHVIGFIFAALGTSILIRALGERGSLMLIPILTGCAVSYYLVMGDSASLAITYVVIRMINYALAYPLRESLYIPTTKELKFKVKSWIDGPGAKVSKSFGSVYNLAVGVNNYYMHLIFFVCIMGVWTITAYMLGKRFDEAVSNNEAIGVEG